MEMVRDPECKDFLAQLPPGKTVDDPRVRTLAMARENYTFASWQALQQAIDTHWGKGLPTDKIPSSFIMGGDWAQAPPLPTRNLAGMNTELASLLPKDALPQEPLNNTGGWPLTEAATKENAESQETAFRTAYNACGFTAQNILATVQAKGGEMQLVHEHQFEGMDAATDFETLMMATVSKTTFFDVVIRQVHEFTIEKHADGKQVLHQGYLSGYNALWWSGHDDELIEEAVAAHPEVAQARELMGKGKPFDRATLRDEIVAKMGDFLRTDVYGDSESKAAWENLPFHPGDTGPEKYQKNDKTRTNKVKILVKVYQPQNEAAVLEALHGNDGDFLSSLVMDEVAEKWDEIKAAKNAE
ncbi:MAG: hypothetical protein AAFX99_29150 [Myxococcota bacterium]